MPRPRGSAIQIDICRETWRLRPIRLIVVSNRTGAMDATKASAGGLAVALRQALTTREGIWLGWSGAVSETLSDEPTIRSQDGVTYATIDLSPEDQREYYSGFANRVLWPTMHYRLGLTHFSRTDYEGYRRVNRRFAQVLARIVRPDDVIWVHDYHLIPLAAELRRLRMTNRIGYFHHIPWPPIEVLSIIPGTRALLEALGAYDVIGLQTLVDEGNLVRALMETTQLRRVGRTAFARDGRICRVRTFPIGIDVEAMAHASRAASARRAVREMIVNLKRQNVVIGVDRLDYSKGLVPRLEAFAAFLELHPEWRRKVLYLQIASPSRMEVPEYTEVAQRVDEASGRVNSALAEPDWTPVRLVKKAYPQQVVAAMYRAARVALVTPMRDGMNLVAKEFVAAQDEADPGVLILSRFAGASNALRDALIVNPFDQMDVVEALKIALDMPLEERQRRWRAMHEELSAHDIHWWTASFLRVLTRAETGRAA